MALMRVSKAGSGSALLEEGYGIHVTGSGATYSQLPTTSAGAWGRVVNEPWSIFANVRGYNSIIASATSYPPKFYGSVDGHTYTLINWSGTTLDISAYNYVYSISSTILESGTTVYFAQ